MERRAGGCPCTVPDRTDRDKNTRGVNDCTSFHSPFPTSRQPERAEWPFDTLSNSLSRLQAHFCCRLLGDVDNIEDNEMDNWEGIILFGSIEAKK